MKHESLPKNIGNREQVYYAGPLDLLNQHTVAVYCSRRIPLSVLEMSEEVVGSLAANGVVLAGGWQSRMEKRLLRVATQTPGSRIVYFLAKGIDQFRVPKALRAVYAADRLLVLSLFRTEKRITRSLVKQRDEWMRHLIDRYFFCYIDPQGTMPHLLQQCLDEDKHVFVLDHPLNTPFIHGAVQAINQYTCQEVLSPYEQ